MAPPPEVYFPSLDACLSGDTQLISWKAAFSRLLKLSTDLESSDNFHRFLSSVDGTGVLSNPFNPFPPPSERSKSDFELKTAAINVAPASRSSYNFDEIKQDTLWLSKQAKIDEVAALRIVILEWQNRPNSKLLNKFSDEEVTSLQDAIGAGNLSKIAGESQALRILKQTSSQNADASDTLSLEARQRELFKLYLSEKLHILKLSQRLLGLCLREKLPYSHATLVWDGTESAPRLPNVRALAASIFKLDDQENGSSQDKISPQECINAVRSRLTNFETGSGCVIAESPDVEIELAWRTNTLEELLQVLQILFLQLQLSEPIPSAKVVLEWLQLMAHYDFLEHYQPVTEGQAIAFAPLQAIISVTTLAFLKIPAAFSYFDTQAHDGNETAGRSADKTPFFMSRESVGEINEIFLNAAKMGRFTASPAIFGWGIIMYTVREIALATKEEREMQQVQNAVESFNRNRLSLSPGAIEQSVYEDVIDRARNPAFEDDFVSFLVSCAVDKCRLFDYVIELTEKLTSVSAAGDDLLIDRWMRVELLDLVGTGINFLDYIPGVVSSALSLISDMGKDWKWPIDSGSVIRCDPRVVFLRDSILINKLFKVAKTRFPYEAVNFLRICRALSGSDISNDDGLPFIAQELAEMETYTHLVSPGFQGYSSTREDENANFVRLARPLEIHETTTPREQIKAGSQSQELVVADMSLIPAETVGQVIRESKPPVIMWHHKYNGLSFLGKWLEQATNNRSYGKPDDETVAEIIGLLADLISSAHHNAKVKQTESGARRILEMASDGLESYSDIISVVFDIFEQKLQHTYSKTSASRDLSPSISCLLFINALVLILPGRVWPFLARSSFLSSDGKGGMLAAVVSSVEASSGNFPLLLTSIRTFDALIDDAVRHAAIRRTVGKVSAVSDHVVEFSAGIPSYIMRNFLLSFLRTMVEVFNGNSTWRYNDPTQQLEINSSLAAIFEKILYYGYGVNDTTEPDSKLTGVVSTSAQYLLSMLRPTSSVLPFNPILRTILDGIQISTSTHHLGIAWLQTRQVQSVLRLSERLIQVGRLNGSPTSTLDKQLFNASPVLIRLYALCPNYQLPVVTLLELLVTSAAVGSADEPPSLLGHLGAESCCSFLDSLSRFDRPFNDAPLYVAIWELLTSIISKRQQWLAVFLLTGSSPRQSLKQAKETDNRAKMNGRPFLQTSLDLVSKIDSIPLTVAVSALEFVSKAQENWPWATPEIKKHGVFFPKMLNYVTNLDMRAYSPLDCCLNTKVAALAADICAMYLHTAKEARDWTFFKTLIPLVSWLSKNAVEADGYNASLHANLKKNFEMKYPGCSLVDIKRTSVARPKLGSHYFYDIDLGSKLFGYHFAWTGTRQQGFVDEVERANLNLSLVETQTELLHSWKFFAIEHCTDFMPDREVQKSMARVVRQCLVSNSRDAPNEHIFHRLQQTRAEFSLGLLQRLVDVKSRGAEVFELLKVAWDAVRLRGPTYEIALVNGDTEYYGSLLNILFLALQFHVAGPSRSAPEALSKKPEISSDLAVILEIVKNVVAQGFRSLTTYLHEEPQKCSPKDFAILTAILQTALRVKDADRIHEQISYHLADMDTPRYAATLFSWSYKLTVEGDPIYGELSMLFLLELTCIPTMAEQLAVDGLLMKLSTYRLTDVLRQSQGCGPFDKIPRLFSIWHAGILPLCLNLVYHVGRTAPEVAAFLNQFEGQLRRASNCFSIGHATATSGSFSASQKGLTRSQSATGLSLGMASEACSLALLSLIIEKFRNAGASAGVDAQGIQELRWDRAQVKDDIEALLEKRSVLRSRIAPTNEKELALSRRAASNSAGGAQSQLEEKIVKELQTVVMCISGGDGV